MAMDYETRAALFFTEDTTPETSIFYIPQAELELYSPVIPFEGGYVVSDFAPVNMVSRDQILILLTDRYTMSAAESMTDMTFNLENSLIIGNRTGGVLNFDLTFPGMTTPYAGMPFGFGSTMFIHPEGHLLEGIGIMPDLWVIGDALEAAIALLSAR